MPMIERDLYKYIHMTYSRVTVLICAPIFMYVCICTYVCVCECLCSFDYFLIKSYL